MQRTIEWYQTHEAEYHRWRFNCLMGMFSRARHMHALLMFRGLILGFPTHDLGVTNETLLHAADCWEKDKDLAYEEFGALYNFPAPGEKIGQTMTEIVIEFLRKEVLKTAARKK